MAGKIISWVLILFLIIILTACATPTQTIVIEELDKTHVDPSWPASVKNIKVDWIVDPATETDPIFVKLSYSDSLLLRSWLEDMKRYIVDVNDMVCYYRTHLNEIKCK